jgi:tellurite resistance protein TerC
MKWPSLHRDHPLHITYRWARRIAIAIVGFTVLLVGVVMIVTPGPAFVVIPVGLGILGLEFAWARRWLQRVKDKGGELAQSAKKRFR